MGRGGGPQIGRRGGGGGASEVLPLQKGGQKLFQPCWEGGTTSFEVVLQ